MLCYAPLLGRPLLALPESSLGVVEVTIEIVSEARLQNPLQAIVGDPAARLVLAAEIQTALIGS